MGGLERFTQGDIIYFNGRDISDLFLSMVPETNQDELRINRGKFTSVISCKGDGEGFGVLSMHGFEFDFGGFSMSTGRTPAIDRKRSSPEKSSVKAVIPPTNIALSETTSKPTAANTHPSYLHRGSDSAEYDYLPKGQAIQCSGSSFVRVREVGENAKIITSGSSCVEIQGNILENVICTLSGSSTINIHGDVHPTVKYILSGSAVLKFDKQPPQSVIDAIVYGSNNKISVPDGFAQHQGASIRRTMNSADAAVIIGKDVVAITGDAYSGDPESLKVAKALLSRAKGYRESSTSKPIEECIRITSDTSGTQSVASLAAGCVAGRLNNFPKNSTLLVSRGRDVVIINHDGKITELPGHQIAIYDGELFIDDKRFNGTGLDELVRRVHPQVQGRGTRAVGITEKNKD